jgi:TolB-like protein/tetratricopeptide (TPR) repeat protein
VSAGALRADLDALHTALNSTPHLSSPEPGSTSVAVLQFDVVGASDEGLIALRDGLVVDIGSRLSHVSGVRVAPRTSTRALAGQSIRQIGAQLGVALVLEGTLQASAAGVRVTANLIDAALETAILPSLVIDRPVGDVLTAQDAIPRDLCEGLSVAFARVPARTHSQDPDAYHAFKRGQHQWKTCFEGGWRQAIEHFQHAIERDPQFVLAHVALANAYNFLGFYGLIKPNLAFAVAGRAAERALGVDATNGAAFIELALARFGGDWDWDGAEQAFRRGLALDPTNALAHVHYSWLLSLLGREDAALAEAQRGQSLAPSSRLVAGARAQTLYVAGRYDEAIEVCSDCLRFDQSYVFAVHVRGLCYLARSMRDAAVADLEQAAALSRRTPFYLAILGRCYGEFGMRSEALGLVAELSHQTADTYVPPQAYVFIYAGLGERERALQYQEKAYEDGASPFNYLSPCIRALYALSPHHKRRLEQMRLVL